MSTGEPECGKYDEEEEDDDDDDDDDSGESTDKAVLAEVPSSSSSSAARFLPRPLVCFDPADDISEELMVGAQAIIDRRFLSLWCAEDHQSKKNRKIPSSRRRRRETPLDWSPSSSDKHSRSAEQCLSPVPLQHISLSKRCLQPTFEFVADTHSDELLEAPFRLHAALVTAYEWCHEQHHHHHYEQ